jgi:hypothetical protein
MYQQKNKKGTRFGAACGRIAGIARDRAGNRARRIGSAAFFLYYPSRRQVPLPLQVFIEFLRKNLWANPGTKT